MGARPLGRKIDELLRVPLSKKILFNDLKDCNVSVDCVDGELKFLDSDSTFKGIVDENGIVNVDVA